MVAEVPLYRTISTRQDRSTPVYSEQPRGFPPTLAEIAIHPCISKDPICNVNDACAVSLPVQAAAKPLMVLALVLINGPAGKVRLRRQRKVLPSRLYQLLSIATSALLKIRDKMS